jgi:hypothetical protein
MTSSCARVHLSLSQSRERVETYGVPRRLAISPSQPSRQASARSAAREGPQVAPVREQRVEDVVEEPAVLAAAETIASADECHGLAVDHEPVGRFAVKCGGDGGVAVVERKLVAGVQPRGAAVLDRQAADAVELALEHPARAGRPLGGQDRLHRRHEIHRRGSFPSRPGRADKRVALVSSRGPKTLQGSAERLRA